ncbi:MAG: hypothetical protein A2359_03665 [Candidatus Moranbacteria bacterium RIFOXYB1_FULL_43_19]|nr:MAG: hypothetical protein A2184_02160 [Candidatus Moranbacteria bacterium RIFOXYA1_FULL_44_7]OGI26743.1 MAG: hypothetical protein A2359_03665 [Candidatus Moranbacteria bacterium RIFOXYB1_FULL_43_19]OGI32470.1 MAG: hypothetical protein A2420_03850 [Candidatus Moranbacteria bacterium RIFOXYC1_FULL_44_13]OGI37627.1 MAG: hypothetical protein A2612_04350 [Candidatus Moranbacteria bacterium RIFOXYD1_FULL_44_12]
MEKYDPQKRFLENQRIEGKKPDKKNPEEQGGISRRDFLKFGALVLGGGAAVLAEKKYGWLGKALGYGKSLAEREKIEEKTETEVEFSHKESDIYPENLQAVSNVLELRDWNPVKIDRETALGTEGFWCRAYEGKNPKLEKSLEDGYLAMHPWIPQLRKIFEDEFRGAFSGEVVPEEAINLFYLALPESHWNWKKDSPKGAAGPYQFMPATARNYGLRVETGFKRDKKGKKIPTGKIDERLDVFKSARAAARCLKDLFARTGDINLALSGYNGGFIWKYLKEPEKPSYEGFLKFIENKINHYKRELPRNNFWRHEVERGWSFEGIAKFFKMDPKILFAVNRDRVFAKKEKNGTVYVMRENVKTLLIPAQAENQKRHIYRCLVAGFVENLNYPPKYNAIAKIISKREFQKKMEERMRGRTAFARR